MFDGFTLDFTIRGKLAFLLFEHLVRLPMHKTNLQPLHLDYLN